LSDAKKASLWHPMRHLRLLFNVLEVARAGSIRGAASRLNLTASALNRRIQDLEAELGTPLFERRARGVQLTAAGEMFVHYARSQTAEAGRLRSQLEDLRGLRRGPVQIACSQALAFEFMAAQIAAFRVRHPRLVFEVKVMDHERALTALVAHETELALVYSPAISPVFRVLKSIPQRLAVIMRSDHPLAAQKTVRLSQCTLYPAALPDQQLRGRQLLDEVAAKRDIRFRVLAESNSFEMLRGLVLRCGMISFQLKIGAPLAESSEGLTARPLDKRDVPASGLVLCQLRGRNLSVAALTFAEALAKSLDAVTASE
jgi:DNA-binding transcriptional LysR family regulator